MKTLLEKLGIDVEIVKKLKRKKGYKLPSFIQFRIIRTEGSSKEIIRWKDSFIEPFDSATLEAYYRNPELFFKDFVRDMRELFLKLCWFYGKYSEGILEKKFNSEEAGGALLTALHLFFYTADIIWRYDRLLETPNPKVSPLGKIYLDMKTLLSKVAKRKGYGEKWIKRISRFLLTSPDYNSPSIRLYSDCSSLMKKYPDLGKILERKNEEEILSQIKAQPKLLKDIKEIAAKYICEPWGIIGVLSDFKKNPRLVEILLEERRRGSKESKKILQEIEAILSSEDLKKLEKIQEKIRWFMEVQEINHFIISKNKVIMDALGSLFMAIQEYFKENIDIFVKETYKNNVRKIVSSLFESDLPRGEYYFLPTLRKLTYVLIAKNWVNKVCKKIYEQEIRLWEDP